MLYANRQGRHLAGELPDLSFKGTEPLHHIVDPGALRVDPGAQGVDLGAHERHEAERDGGQHTKSSPGDGDHATESKPPRARRHTMCSTASVRPSRPVGIRTVPDGRDLHDPVGVVDDVEDAVGAAQEKRGAWEGACGDGGQKRLTLREQHGAPLGHGLRQGRS